MRRPTLHHPLAFHTVPAWALLAVTVAISGCSKLTKVNAPDALQPGQLVTPSGAEVLRAGAVYNMYYYVLGYVYGVPAVSGLMTDELITGNDPVGQLIDERRVTPANMWIPYRSIHRARIDFQQAILAYRQFPSLSQVYTAHMYAMEAFTETYFGEVFCAGVPLTTIVNNTPQYGTSLTTAQMFQQAVAHFDSAIALTPDTVRFLYLAQVGLGRVLVDLGQFSTAAAAVHNVPTSFVFNAEESATLLQSNTIGLNQQFSKAYGVADKQGTNGLDFISSGDPRIQASSLGFAGDGVTQIYLYLPYASASSPVPIATGVEARLIEAEASLQAGDAPTWLTTLNTLRTDGTQTGGVYNAGTGGVAGLAPLADPGTADSRVDLMFRERAFWMYFTGHRLGDLRRLIRQYGRGAETVFPTGPYKNLGTFGTDVNLPVANTENPNPKFHGCLDRNA